MLNEKMKQSQEEKTNSIKQMNLPRQTQDEESYVQSNCSIHRSTISIKDDEDQSIQRKDLEEENHLLKEIINQAATAIADVIQVNELSLSLA